MKSQYAFIFIIICLLLVPSVSAAEPFDAATYGNFTDFIVNSTSTQINYQIKILLSNSSGFSKTNIFYTNNTTRGNWFDVAFTDTSNATLGFWKENGTDTAKNSTWWVNVSSFSSDNTTRVRMFYGNLSKTESYMNGTDTFYFFDDFSRSDSSTIGNGWAETAGNWSIKSGKLVGMPTGNTLALGAVNPLDHAFTFSGKNVVEAYSKRSDYPLVSAPFYVHGKTTKTMFGLGHSDTVQKFQKLLYNDSWTATGTSPNDTYAIIGIMYNYSSDLGNYYINRVLSESDERPTDHGSATVNDIVIGSYRVSGSPIVTYDWVIIRNWTESEPFFTVNNTEPVSSFTSNVTSGSSPTEAAVQFTDTSDYSYSYLGMWKWNATNVAGDNIPVTFSTDQNPVYTFSPGNYSITLTIYNASYSNTSTQVTFINISYICYSGSYGAWVAYGDGWKSQSDQCIVIKWNSSGTKANWVPEGNVTSNTYVEYVIVGAGGAGGRIVAGGGGGAGAVWSGYTNGFTTPTDIIIGAGGEFGAQGGGTGTSGGNSTFGSITANGGSSGSVKQASGTPSLVIQGGSAGGGAHPLSAGTGPSNDTNQAGHGRGGGTGLNVSETNLQGGGGGGYATNGSNAASNKGGNGGNGTTTNITGTILALAGGGGGGVYNNAISSRGTGGSANGEILGGSGGYGSTSATSPVASTGSGGGGGAGSVFGFARNGSSGIIIIRYANISIDAPISSFTTNVTSGFESAAIQFNDTSTNTPTSWIWNATNVTGNNTPFTFSNIQNATYTFGVGNFSISLNSSNGGGSNVSTQITYINVSRIVADFTSNVTTSQIYPLVVRFNDTSIDTPLTWNWSFGDGRWFNTTNPALKNTTYQYAVAGKYIVNLTVNNTYGNNTKSVTNYINLTSDNDANLTVWLHMNGTNGSTTFTGEKGVAWTRNGGAYITTNVYKYGGASGAFPSALNSYISATTSPALNLSTNDFTIEFWVNVTSVSGTNVHIISKTNNPRNRGWGLDRTNDTAGDGGWDFWMGNDSGGQTFFNASIPNKTWVHIAVERISGTVYLYINGNLTATKSGFNANYDTADPLWIGRQSGNYFNGYIDEFRISNTLARWKSNFTPPYNEYQGTLETIYPDINPDSTFRYKTNPGGMAYIDNLTQRNRTLQIQNITNTSYVLGAITFNPLYVFVKSAQLNTTYYATGMTLISSTIDNTNGIIEFNISKPTGFSPGTDRASILDYTSVYYNYTDGSQNVSEYFADGYLINGTTSHIYPIHNFLETQVTYGDWNFTAGFTADNVTLFENTPTLFTSTFTGSYPNRWNWSFGDGTFNDGTNSSISHIYTTGGLKTVILTEYLWQNLSINSTSTKIDYINVTATPVSSFTTNVTSGLTPSVAVQFNDTTINYPSSWEWNATNVTGNNTPFTFSTIQNATYVFGIGNFSISLNTSNGAGSNVSTQVTYINLSYSQTVSGFIANETSGGIPPVVFPVGFNVTTVNDNATMWNWSFGDGIWENGTTQNVTHIYNSGGNFTVIEIASNPLFTNMTTMIEYINISQWNQTRTGFTVNATYGLIPLPIGFNVTLVNDNATIWNWSFGDGTWSNGTTQNVTHLYADNGTFTIMEIASNGGFSNTTTLTNYILTYNQTIANFTSNITVTGISLPVQFINTSTNDTGWAWYFGDENITQDVWSQQNVSAWGNRYGARTVSLSDGSLILMGGYNSSTYFADVWRSTNNGITWVQQTSNAGWGGRYRFGAVVLPDDSIVIMGGGGVARYNDVWRSTDKGVSWIRQTSGASWSKRDGFCSVSSPNGSIIIMGGSTPTLMNDVWISVNKGISWTQQTGGASWLKRDSNQGGCTVLQNGSIVLAGGYGSATPYNDVWGSNDEGVTWSQINASAGWSARYGHTLVTLPDNELLLMGGNLANDMWVSKDDGVTWQLKNASSGWSGRHDLTSSVMRDGSVIITGGYNVSGGPNILSDVWRVDIASSSLANPIHIYQISGNYTVTEIASSPNHYNITRIYYMMNISNSSISGFTANVTSGIAPLSIGFNVTSVNDNATMWNWSFGDGIWENGTTQNVTHTYGNGGVFTIIEIASNAVSTNTTIRTDYITLYNQTVSGFTANVTSGVASLSIGFNVTTVDDNATMWNWSFGDGSWENGTTQNVTHVYGNGGVFTIIEIASNSGSSNTTTRTDYITLYNQTVSGFTANTTSGIAPLSIGFNVTLVNDNATMWNWSFGDGIWSNGTTQNVTHTYGNGGVFTIIEIASNAVSTNTTIRTDYITLYNQTVSGFTANVTSGVAPLSVGFNVTLVDDNATMWNWSFGDGIWENGTTQNVTHIYLSNGVYNVSEITSNAGTTNMTTRNNYISVFYAPSTTFSANPISGSVPLTVIFNDTSGNGPTMWNWSFGDGTWQNGTTQNATHTYTISGSYTVILITTNVYGSSNYSRVISALSALPIANFTATPNIGVNPLDVIFTDTSIGDVINWSWSFGDGNVSYLQNPMYTYLSLGTYPVRLTIQTPVGDNISRVQNIYVVSNPLPMVDFVGTPTSGVTPLTVTFTDLTSGGKTEWNWSFGDGNYSNVQNPVHIYSSGGQYSVTLVVTNSTYTNFTSKIGYINVNVSLNAVSANYTGTPRSGNYPLTVQFYDTSVCNPVCTNWNWDLDGDGSTDSNAKNPSFNYTYPLAYSPKLIASNGVNSGTRIHLKYINVGPTYIPTTIPQPTQSWVPGYQDNQTGLSVSFKGDSSIDLNNGTYLKYWLQNFTATGEFNVYGFVVSIMAPLMHVFGFWIYLIIWGLYLFAVWIRSQDVTLPLIIGIISIGTFGLLFPKEALPVIIVMFVVCGAIIITKLMKDSL